MIQYTSHMIQVILNATWLDGWMDVFTSSILTIYFTLYTHNNKFSFCKPYLEWNSHFVSTNNRLTHHRVKVREILQVELPEDILSSLCDREYTLLAVDDALGKSGVA